MSASPVQPPRYRGELLAPALDVDEYGHISNIAYVRWIQDVALAHSRAVGWDIEAYKKLGALFVVRRHEIDYLAPAYAGDRLELVTWVAENSGARCVRRTVISRVGPTKLDLIRAATTWAFVAIDTGRPRRIPQELVRAFAVELPLSAE